MVGLSFTARYSYLLSSCMYHLIEQSEESGWQEGHNGAAHPLCPRIFFLDNQASASSRQQATSITALRGVEGAGI